MRAALLAAFCLAASSLSSQDIHFAPTPHAVADAMLQLAGVSAADVVYDLGSGDGRIPIIAAQKYGARGVGIEIDPRLVALSRDVAREGGVADRVTFVEGNLFTTDISSATVVTPAGTGISSRYSTRCSTQVCRRWLLTRAHQAPNPPPLSAVAGIVSW